MLLLNDLHGDTETQYDAIPGEMQQLDTTGCLQARQKGSKGIESIEQNSTKT